MENPTKLQGNLKQRHITMISIGGVIGAGLFIGSGLDINKYGPAVIISYLTAGILVVLVMRMLGEMTSVRVGVPGSFKAYATEAFGPAAGYSIGWLYYFFWMYIIALEASVGADLLHSLIPSMSAEWLTSLVLTLLLTFTNLVSVKSYGEFEYWFAIIKVAAIIVFLVLGTMVIIGIFPGVESPGFSNLLNEAHGGFMPKGINSILLGMLFIMFAFFGTEIGVIAVNESENPKKAVHTVINSVVWRILVFYIGSILVISMLIPTSDAAKLQNPFASIFDTLGIPYAGTIVQIVVLTSVLSCLNSALYTNSRMLFSLALEGDAPRYFAKLSKSGVPVRAVWASTLFAYLAVILKFLDIKIDLFGFIANAAGAICLLVYLIIAMSHIRLRNRDKGKYYPIKMWLFPYLSYAVILLLIVTLVAMFFAGKELAHATISTFAITAFVIITFFMLRRGKTAVPSKPTSQASGE
ncbi:amino acid permease [Neobacillus sp. OS1-33]|nr:amino acid permease [Neobacillus sp. OS1-33]WML27231.1 amino acid permease [Neobacillus sp. OS1-33]